MSSIDAGLRLPPATPSFLERDYGILAWLTTRDHKRIGILYALAITMFFIMGGVAATLIRLDLLEPGGLLDAETYNKAFTFHGVIMVWFFLIPSIPASLGNFLLPLMIGARDVAFPRLNLASWYLFMIGGLFTMAALLLGGVLPDHQQQLLLALVLHQLAQREPAASRDLVELRLVMHAGGRGAGE